MARSRCISSVFIMIVVQIYVVRRAVVLDLHTSSKVPDTSQTKLVQCKDLQQQDNIIKIQQQTTSTTNLIIESCRVKVRGVPTN